MTQSMFVDQAGQYGTGEGGAGSTAVGLFDFISAKVAALIPGGPVSADAAASNGATASKFPPNGDPIVSQETGLGTDALTQEKGEAIVQPSTFGNRIPPWMLLAGAVVVVYVLTRK